MALILKEIADSDLDAFVDLMCDVTLARNSGSIPYPVDHDWARERIEYLRAQEAEGKRADRGLFEGDVLVGTVTWFINGDGNREIGYGIHRDHRGRGLATKAGQMAVDWVRATGYAGPIYAQHFQDNPASGRVLEKLGFVREGPAVGVSPARATSAPAWKTRLDPVSDTAT